MNEMKWNEMKMNIFSEHVWGKWRFTIKLIGRITNKPWVQSSYKTQYTMIRKWESYFQKLHSLSAIMEACRLCNPKEVVTSCGRVWVEVEVVVEFAVFVLVVTVVVTVVVSLLLSLLLSLNCCCCCLTFVFPLLISRPPWSWRITWAAPVNNDAAW